MKQTTTSHERPKRQNCWDRIESSI